MTAGLVGLFLFWLGTRGLNEPDEGRYANIALAMARPGGDWWEPRMSGYGHYDKPPLIYWATALGFRAFGVNEWAARLPSLLGAFFALGGLGWAAYRLRGARAAWWAVLICGTSVQFWVFGRILSPDMLLTGWCTLAVAAWAEGRWKAEGRRQKAEGGGDPQEGGRGGARGWWLLSLLFWTLAWWTKATPALVPLAGLMMGVWMTRDRAGRRALRIGWMLVAILVLGSPWYLSMLGRYPELKSFFFGRELAGRLAGRVDGRHGSLLYYVPLSFWAWLPWWPVAAWAGWRGRGRLLGGLGRVEWTQRLGVEGWIVLTGLLIFSLAGSKLPSYTLTLAPWAALLMARAVAGAAPADGGWRGVWWLPAAGFALVAMVTVAVLPGRRESRLGVNSSLQEVCAFLRRRGAARVDADRYWAGLEFYLREQTVRYVVRTDTPERPDEPGPADDPTTRIERYHERDSDPGVPPERFVHPEVWLKETAPGGVPHPGDRWFIRFYPLEKPVFDEALRHEDVSQRPVKVVRIGDFDVYRLPDPR